MISVREGQSGRHIYWPAWILHDTPRPSAFYGPAIATENEKAIRDNKRTMDKQWA